MLAEWDVYVFARAQAKERIITILNRGETVRIRIPVWKLGINNRVLTSFIEVKEYAIKGGYLEYNCLKGSEILIV